MDETLLTATVLGAICFGIGLILLNAKHLRRDRTTSVVKRDEREATVVACDLVGFAAYAEAIPSRAVSHLLAEYREALCRVAAELDGTVTAHAGDRILVQPGVPLPRDDGAGVALVRRIHEAARPVIERWSTAAHPLGLQVDVATNRVDHDADALEACGTEVAVLAIATA